jgi:outer membrane protein assembly factor BamD (BamD/ComL family)
LTVTEAIRALRTDHDTARAEHLLDEYLMRHPHGLLSEDALALSIEAAATEHDPRAIANARRYLASFPHGKYRAFARRVADAPK